MDDEQLDLFRKAEGYQLKEIEELEEKVPRGMSLTSKLILGGAIVLTGLSMTCSYALSQEPAPSVVKENLIGFTLFPNNVISLEWDLNGDNVEDLKVFYYGGRCRGAQGYCTTPKPWAYWQDLNNDGIYQKEEKFMYSSHE